MPTSDDRPVRERRVRAHGIDVNVAVAGSGPAVVLLHGFPHTWQVWEPLFDALATHHTIIAPDLRGFGGTTRAEAGYDAGTIVDDTIGLLDALAIDRAAVVAIDLATTPAVLLGLRHPDRVAALAVMEGLVGSLAGAESFLEHGPPWWFGFHAVPNLAERVVGDVPAYADFFLDAGTRTRPVLETFRQTVHRSLATASDLHAALEHYRALPTSAAQVQAAIDSRLRMPTLTVGAASVGSATADQLRAHTDDLQAHVLPDAGHIIPQDQPAELLSILGPWLRRHTA